MDARRFLLLIPMVWLVGLAAVAQNTTAAGDDPGPFRFTIARANLHLLNSASFDGQGFVLPPNTPGESSSRKHSNGTGEPGGQAVAVQGPDTSPCAEPAKIFSPRDYSGPLNRFAAWFSRKPEIVTVPSKHRTGQNICSLDTGEKFHLFYKSTIEPVTFMASGVVAGWSQWQNDDKEWGQGAEGYGKRYAAAFTDRATRNFFRRFFYPSLFRQDPRYFRKGTGGTGGRIGYAIGHSFVTRTDSGGRFANISLWAAIASTAAIEPLYHPGRDHGFGPGAKHFGYDIGKAMGWDVLREFWPEVVRKLRLPFRERHVVPAPATTNP